MSEAIKNVFGLTPLMSDKMRSVINQALAFYTGTAPHNMEMSGTGEQLYPSLRYPNILCTETAGDVVTGFETCIVPKKDVNETVNIEFIEYVEKQYVRFIDQYFLLAAEKLNASGTIALRPFVFRNEIHIAIHTADTFDIYETNDIGEVTCVGFKETFVQSETKKVDGVNITTQMLYTLYEIRSFEPYNDEINNSVSKIDYKATKQTLDGGEEIEMPLTDVSKWQNYESFQYIGAEMPWFVIIKTPFDNIFENNSLYGMPLHAPAMGLMKKSDMHAARIDREVRFTEIKIDVHNTLLRILKNPDGTTVKDTSGAPVHVLPEGEDAIFRAFGNEHSDGNDNFGIKVYNPEPRVESYRGYSEILKRDIEYASMQAYGTLSQQPVIERTATEINAQKRKNIRMIQRLQARWQIALELTVAVIAEMTDALGLAGKKTDYKVEYTWDASLSIDPVQEFNETIILLARNVVSPEQVFDKYKTKLRIKGEYHGDPVETHTDDINANTEVITENTSNQQVVNYNNA